MKPKYQGKNDEKDEHVRENVPQPGTSKQSNVLHSVANTSGILKAKNLNTDQELNKSAVEKAVVNESSGGNRMLKYKELLYERQKAAYYTDRKRMAQLKAIIFADPPPHWDVATKIWEEVYKLEERIEEFEESNPET